MNIEDGTLLCSIVRTRLHSMQGTVHSGMVGLPQLHTRVLQSASQCHTFLQSSEVENKAKFGTQRIYTSTPHSLPYMFCTSAYFTVITANPLEYCTADIALQVRRSTVLHSWACKKMCVEHSAQTCMSSISATYL